MGTVRTVKILGDAIREARTRAHLTQGELGEFVGVDRYVIARLENGQLTAQMRRLLDVLDAVGMEIHVAPRAHRLAVVDDEAVSMDTATGPSMARSR